MRLYRFIGEDIDVTLVTDGSCNQKKVFITESPRGIVSPGQVLGKDEPNLGAKLQAMGFNWKAGQEVMHEELVAFAKNNALTLEINPQGLNEVVAVEAEWNDDDACVLTIRTSIPAKKEVEITFPNTVTLNESVSRFGVIRGDKKSLAAMVMSKDAMAFTLEDLGLAAKEDLNVVVTAESGIQKFKVTAEM